MKKAGQSTTKARSPNLSQRSATIPSINTDKLDGRSKQSVHIREMEALRSLSIGSPVPRASSLDDEVWSDGVMTDESFPAITVDVCDVSASSGKILERENSDRRKKTEGSSKTLMPQAKTLTTPSCLPDQIRPGVVAYTGTVQLDPSTVKPH